MVTIFACSQEEDISNRSFLLSGENSKSWQVIAIKQEGKEGIPVSCEADDVETFFHNANYSYGHGSKSCNNDSNLDGTWVISEDFKSITITYNDDSYFATTYTIVSLNNEEMILEQNSFFNTQYTYQLVE